MEKKNYLKPAIELHGISPTTSFMAVSDLIIEDTNPEVATLIDGCVQFGGNYSSNDEVISSLKRYPNNSNCFTVQRWESVDPTKTDICTDPRFINGQRVRITYDETNKQFIFDFDGCTSSGGGYPWWN